VFFCYWCTICVPSVLWYCWLGLLTCKNRLPYNLYCVGGDIKHCSLTHSLTHYQRESWVGHVIQKWTWASSDDVFHATHLGHPRQNYVTCINEDQWTRVEVSQDCDVWCEFVVHNHRLDRECVCSNVMKLRESCVHLVKSCNLTTVIKTSSTS